MSKTVKLFLALFVIMFFNVSPCQACYDDDDDDYYNYYDDSDDDCYDWEIELPEIEIIGKSNDENKDKNWDNEIELPNVDIFGDSEDPFSIIDDSDDYDMEVELPNVTIIGNGNSNSSGSWADKSASWLNAHAYTYAAYKSKKDKECAKYVRLALEAGGIDTAGHPEHAKDYGDFLKKIGFHEVSKEGYSPQKGDIRVWQNYPGGNISGHIHMYDGSQWVSDFFEPNNHGPGPRYRKYNNYKIYWK